MKYIDKTTEVETRRARKRREAEARAAEADARDWSFRALALISAIPLAAFPDDFRKQAGVHKRAAAEAVRELRKLIPKHPERSE